MTIIRLKDTPELLEPVLAFIKKEWGSVDSNMVYDDCIRSMMTSESALPEWYAAYEDETVIGCVGLVPNDFISRMDLWPWLVALYVDPEHRNQGIGKALIDICYTAIKEKGFETMYLCTDHTSLYEHLGFEYIGDGYHPWGESSRIYKK